MKPLPVVMVHNPQERLDRLARAVVNYRKTKQSSNK